VTSYKVI